MYLELTDISKKIGADEVLSGITLSMEKGKVYGLQGKNGCGKSMLMRVICGLVLPTVGEVKIEGKILGKEFSFPPSVGVFIEKPGFLDSYSGLQNLMMLASIKGQISGAEVKDVLKRVGLQDVMYKKYRKYSLGMKQKLGIAAAIMEKPELIILDEPSNALDEKSEEILWQIVGEEKERGALILISCHTTETLEKVSDEIFRMVWTNKRAYDSIGECMRKKIIIIMTAIVLFGGFIAGYRNINQKYPARKVETAEKGESLEFLDGVKISANGIKWLSTEEQEAIYENSGIDTSKVNYDTKIIEVSVCLKNTTEEEKEVPITYLSLETTGVGTAISQELLMGNSEHYGSMVEN